MYGNLFRILSLIVASVVMGDFVQVDDFEVEICNYHGGHWGFCTWNRAWCRLISFLWCTLRFILIWYNFEFFLFKLRTQISLWINSTTNCRSQISKMWPIIYHALKIVSSTFYCQIKQYVLLYPDWNNYCFHIFTQ